MRIDEAQLKNLLDFSNAAASIITVRKCALKAMLEPSEITALQKSHVT